jgi:hypothetical protein
MEWSRQPLESLLEQDMRILSKGRSIWLKIFFLFKTRKSNPIFKF